MSRFQSRRHHYYLKKYLKLVGIAIAIATQAASPSTAQVKDSGILPEIRNTAKFSYQVNRENGSVIDVSGNLLTESQLKEPLFRESLSNNIPVNPSKLDPLADGGPVDPAGRITGCNGETLPNYEGFTVGIYETPDTVRLGNLLSLTPTPLPGIPPNGQNSNPYALTTGNKEGKYNFLLDPNKNQLAIGRNYILVIKPPLGSIYTERQVLLTIDGVDAAGNVTIRARSLNGQVLVNGVNPVTETTITAPAQTLGTTLSLLGVNAGVCNPQVLQIVKSADRAAAEPGDTVVYRLMLKNLSTTQVSNIQVNDTLPLGFRLQTNAVIARQDNAPVPVAVQQNGNVVTFTFPPIEAGKTINLAYATTLTPDAIRGTGKNSALLTGTRTGTNIPAIDGPAIHQLQIRQGILSDTGTIIGRVFIDKNFDGEQQPNEPGVPNAVIFLDDGNKITTDANGMFTVKGATNGYRTGVLDLSSLPGYTLAPNLYIKERNSQSRLVKLAPSGLVRMNFGVTPTAREAK